LLRVWCYSEDNKKPQKFSRTGQTRWDWHLKTSCLSNQQDVQECTQDLKLRLRALSLLYHLLDMFSDEPLPSWTSLYHQYNGAKKYQNLLSHQVL
jgi:hypothetical protein